MLHSTTLHDSGCSFTLEPERDGYPRASVVSYVVSSFLIVSPAVAAVVGVAGVAGGVGVAAVAGVVGVAAAARPLALL